MRSAQQYWQVGDPLRCIFLIATCLTLGHLAEAQTTSNQVWPEIDAYHSFSQKMRLKLVASRSTDGNDYNSIEVGPTLNIFAKRFVQPRLSTLNREKDHLLAFGIGYRYLAGLNQAPENRAEFDVTPQIPLPWKMQLAVRSRIDLRFIEGSDFSWRYRNRPVLQRSFKMHGFVFSPYAQVEFFYSSASASWNKTTYQAGVDIPAGKHFSFEPYYERDNNKLSTPNRVNAYGLTVSIYL
jgi:hypothetical protein